MPSLDGPRAKYRRALEHMEILERELVQFGHDNPTPHVEHFDRKTGRYTVAIKFCHEPDTERWGILLGDAIHNLRCALDHIVWQLVLLNGEKPGRHTQWPASRTEEQYRNPRKNGRPSVRDETLRGVAEKAKAVIDEFQPYRAGMEVHRHFLTLLIPLSNADKHRIIQAGFVGTGEPPQDFLAHNEDVGDMLEGGTFAVGRLKKDANVVDCRFAVTGPNPHVQMQGDLGLLVGFGEQGFDFRRIGEMTRMVGQTIDVFQSFFVLEA